MTEPFIWIDDDRALKKCAEDLSTTDVLAIDTEFVRTDSFYAHLGLIQIAQGDKTWLVDPLKITDWSPLVSIIEDRNIVKVLHALSEDAEVLQHHLGASLVNVFDSQIAAAYLGYAMQTSYAKLVESLFDIVLPKEATRSDWLQRPLAEEQCRYAAGDVHWLYKIYDIFARKLKAQDRYQWVKDDSQRMVSNNLPIEPAKYYLKLRGAWKLKGSRLVALKMLCAWREEQARQSNVNRGRILHDKDIILLAERLPTSKSDLQKLLKIPSRKIRLYGDELLQMIQVSLQAKKADWPARIESPLPAEQAGTLKAVKQLVRDAAAEVGLPVELLARRKELESWLRSGARTGDYQIPESLSGWRSTLLAEPVHQYLTTQWETSDEA